MLTRSAPSKVNLFLHVMGKRDDGYHELESLVVFTAFGDDLTLTPAKNFQLTICGPHATDIMPDTNQNLVGRAAFLISEYADHPLDCHLMLAKNIPVAAGLGGGSADAAATLLILNDHWGCPLSRRELHDIALQLGADVPMCLYSKACFVQGIGEKITPVSVPSLSCLLINPQTPCLTAEIFKHLTSPYNIPTAEFPPHFTVPKLIAYLNMRENKLTHPALDTQPVIQDVLDTLKHLNGCRFAQMTGSGATCFGLFDHEELAHKARLNLTLNKPEWWSVVTRTLS